MSHPFTPCLIIGAGPAGVSAAQWFTSLHVPYTWVSRGAQIGGGLHRVHNPVLNYPGAAYQNGAELADALKEGLHGAGVAGPLDTDIRAIECSDEGFWRALKADGGHLDASTVILATGACYRQLGVPGEDAGLQGGWVSQSSTRDAHLFAGRDVAVVGGGDSGFENALKLASKGCRVKMLLRNPTFRARATFVERALHHPDIALYPTPTLVKSITRTPGGCRLALDVAGTPDTLDVACLFVKIGVQPVLPEVPDGLARRAGFLEVDHDQMTTLPGLFAAGDITACPLRSVASSVGSAADAAKSVVRWLDSR